MSAELAIVIPTRNRSDFARLAIGSVVSQLAGERVRVIVSDNSTDEGQSAELAELVAALGCDAVTLIRPSGSMAMTEHWEWAVSRAMELVCPTHLLILTDRMAFKRGALATVLGAVSRFPNEIVSYTYDRVDDNSSPVRYLELPRTGRLYRMPATELLALSARMQFFSFLPRMLNCVVPVPIINQLRNVHGTLFASVSPDYCFCYRALDSVTSIVYLDESVLVNYGQLRSNGASFGRGVNSADSVDFINAVGMTKINSMTPVPQILTVGNAVAHEYLSVAAGSKSGKFPALSREAYLRFLGLEHLRFADARQRDEGLRTLRSEGLRQDLNFHISAAKQAVEKILVRILSRRFSTMEAAVSFATQRGSRRKAWLRFILRRYQLGTLVSTSN